jgi:hypothetical protein
MARSRTLRAGLDQEAEELKVLSLNVNALHEILFEPQLEKAFRINPAIFKEIKQSMKAGYQAEHPIFIWRRNGEKVLIDGYTRTKAAMEIINEAKENGERPPFESITYKEFPHDRFTSIDEALSFVDTIQLRRRNITDADILHFLDRPRSEVWLRVTAGKYSEPLRGAGELSDHVAQYFNGILSRSKVIRALRVLKEAPVAAVQQIYAGESTIASVEQGLKTKKEILSLGNTKEALELVATKIDDLTDQIPETKKHSRDDESAEVSQNPTAGPSTEPVKPADKKQPERKSNQKSEKLSQIEQERLERIIELVQIGGKQLAKGREFAEKFAEEFILAMGEAKLIKRREAEILSKQFAVVIERRYSQA